jgi:hypothetical protein
MIPALLSLFLAAAPGAPDGVVTAKGHTFQAEVARTPETQARGLMYRPSLARNRCMIFLYDQDGNHRIWMKNCLIALDVAWVKADGTVVEISENTPPCSPMRGDDCPVYGGTLPARHFVEFPAGTVRRIGLRIGDRLGWRLTLDGEPVSGGAPAAAGRKRLAKAQG